MPEGLTLYLSLKAQGRDCETVSLSTWIGVRSDMGDGIIAAVQSIEPGRSLYETVAATRRLTP